MTECYSLQYLQLKAIIVVLGVITSRIFHEFMCRQFCARAVHDFSPSFVLPSSLSHFPSPPHSCNCSCALVCLRLCNHTQAGAKSTCISLGQSHFTGRSPCQLGNSAVTTGNSFERLVKSKIQSLHSYQG